MNWPRRRVLANFSWTSILGSRMVNEVKVGRPRRTCGLATAASSMRTGNDVPWDTEVQEWTALNGGDPHRLRFGAAAPGLPGRPARRDERQRADARTSQRSAHLHAHQPHAQVRRGRQPEQGDQRRRRRTRLARSTSSTTRRSIQPRRPRTHRASGSALGEMFIPIGTWRVDSYASDKWQLTPKVTLNLGVRGTTTTTTREHQGRLRAASWCRVRSQRADRASGGLREVLRVSRRPRSSPTCSRAG